LPRLKVEWRASPFTFGVPENLRKEPAIPFGNFLIEVIPEALRVLLRQISNVTFNSQAN
jgi:hypothetical protein